MIDKNLFAHELAVVAIMKNEGTYLKEWLDYHLSAGVDHFYLYDNESTDNQLAVAAPYVKAGLVDYFHAPGKVMQILAYNDAIKRFRFRCRYMAFIDGDEFIYPRTGGGIVETVDEILSHDPNAAGVAINWQCFGSGGQETADFSRGVLERFTRRAPTDWNANNIGNAHVKTVADPRAINFIDIPHHANYFEQRYAVNEQGKLVPNSFNLPVTADKIVVNHYYTKSREEIAAKFARGRSDFAGEYDTRLFDFYDRNEVFDDGILRYRDERAKNFQPPDMSRVDERLLNALTVNLSPTLLQTTPPNFYAGKMETFLTCRAVAAYLKTKLVDESSANFFEEAALKAILKSITGMSLADARLWLSELPELLTLPYPAADEMQVAAEQIVPQIMSVMHTNRLWKNFTELDYILRLLQTRRPPQN